MALTNKEKLARRRQRLKEDPEMLANVREKDRMRKSKSRKERQGRMTESEFHVYRLSERDRIRKHRTEKLKRLSKAVQEPFPLPYKTPQAMGKAIKRAKTSLPFSPRRRQAVVAAIAKECGLPIATINKKPGPHGLSDELKAKISSFFQNDEISWQASLSEKRTDGENRKRRCFKPGTC